ncbi:uncharacterized protein LOC131613740 [Vicia villosa]|uniref:uncharacterized protein LOC131613740 n=1 Tax=Vicia villosa TaxID=3911 RepID=UPI00273B8192|nr:uncharacterized protein LOC131613740 [Vicia villosa]
MAGKNDAAIVAALEAVTQAMQNHPNARVMDESRSLTQKVHYDTHMLAREADDWEFLRKYFPKDVRRKKEMEFLALKQKNSNVTEYTGKFLELMNFYPHYSAETVEFLKCIKFESGLRLEIKWSVNEKRGKPHHDCRKPYDSPTEKGKQKVSDWKKTSGGGALAPVTCYRYGEQGHHFNECENKVLRCYKYGKTIHHAPDCKDDDPTCFNYGEQGHIGT